MVYFCDACRQIYDVNLTGITCIYCGAHRRRPYEPQQEEETTPTE